jgi:hypothetical protein
MFGTDDLVIRNKDDKEIVCKPIGEDGRVGQIVVLAKVVLPKIHEEDPNKLPWKRYQLPQVFTIVEKKYFSVPESGYLHGYYYVLADTNGKHLETTVAPYYKGQYILYDIQEWLAYQKAYQADQFEERDSKIVSLEQDVESLAHDVELLRDILVRQSVKIVTEEEAEQLGL